MSLTSLFIRRPVATTLLTIAVTIAGAIAFGLLPVAPLPQVDSPTIRVRATVPGASPEVMAATVATPLERVLGRIAGITEITSNSKLGKTDVTLQFELSKDIDGAAREVQAAINAARTLLPTSLSGNPTYKKSNQSEQPIIILALTSETESRGEMYDLATTIVAQKISQIEGVGEVTVYGGALPAVRVNTDPARLNAYGISSETVRKAISATNANTAKGFVESGDKRWTVVANDQAPEAGDYPRLVVASRNGAPVRLGDVATVYPSVEDELKTGLLDNKPAIVMAVTRQPGANIIETVERIKERIPELRAYVPGSMHLDVTMDRSLTIRSSLHEVEFTLLLSIVLVTAVVFVFLREGRATLIPAISVPVSIIGTFAVMYLAGFSLNNFSLMALTIATGFVVDDAIVVLENISRHIEEGVPRFEAAIRGAKEVAFTVLSISLSLIAVFIPVLLMGGFLGQLFREFAITLSVAIVVSLVISLTTTPMMCAFMLRRHAKEKKTEPSLLDRFFESLLSGYSRTLAVALRHPAITLSALLATVALNVALYVAIPKGLLPQQDTGMLMGFVQVDQSASFKFTEEKIRQYSKIVGDDPAIATLSASADSSGGRLFASLKTQAERGGEPIAAIMDRLRKKAAAVTGAQLVFFAPQDIKMGGRMSSAAYQYTLQSDDLAMLKEWTPIIKNALAGIPLITDVNVDSQDHGLQTHIVYDREKMARLGVTVAQANDTLYDAFGQRQISTIYKPLNQYRVVLEVEPRYRAGPRSLDDVRVVTDSGARVPLSSFAAYDYSNAPLSVNHQGQFVASTVSFNLATGASLSEADDAIRTKMAELGVPTAIRGGFQGTAKLYQDSLSSLPILVLSAIVAMYIVLGILYESYIHPITILSTLPSAGVGALLAMKLFGLDFTLISLIGVLLLIGIVKKNAIMMIDFAIGAERSENLTSEEAIYRACLLRFRPIMMTTMAALLGALPLAVGFGEGSEMRRPLGIAIVGGLIVSQALTLYTTPVVYLYFDRLQSWIARRRVRRDAPASAPIAATH